MGTARKLAALGASFCLLALLAAELPPTARARLSEALGLAGRGALPQAEAILLELENAHPPDPEVQYRLGLVLLRQNKTEAAVSRLEQAVELKPEIPFLWLALAQARLQIGRRDRALEAARKAGERAGDDAASTRALAMFYAQAEEPDPAIDLARKLLLRGDDALLRNLLGKALRQKGEPARAVEELQRAIRLQPERPAYYLDLAGLFLDHRTPEPAAVVLESALARFPRHAELHRLLGLARYATGDNAKALDAFLTVTDLQPDSEAAYASLETLLPEAGEKLPVIINKLRGFRERHPESPLGHFLLAQALFFEDHGTAAAEKLLRQAVELQPDFWPGWFELHKVHAARQEVQTAVRLLEKVLQLNPNHAPAHYELAALSARVGDRERAIRHRRRHHELVTADQKAAERRREKFPALPYELESR